MGKKEKSLINHNRRLMVTLIAVTINNAVSIMSCYHTQKKKKNAFGNKMRESTFKVQILKIKFLTKTVIGTIYF